MADVQAGVGVPAAPRGAAPLLQSLLAVAIVAVAYLFVLHERLQQFPQAFVGFGFHPEALWQAPASKQLHVAAGAIAVVLGLLQLWLPKGTGRHRALGYTWVAVMVTMCTSALFIADKFGLLQMLAVVVLGLLVRAVWLARRHDVARHSHLMRVLVLGATLGVGLFTALPGRVTWMIFFSGHA
jgi:uncharacterized membrane protein